MDNGPDFLRQRLNQPHASGRLDEITSPYRSLLAEWLIQLTLCLGWAHRSRHHLRHLPDVLEDDDYLAVTGIRLPPSKKRVHEKDFDDDSDEPDRELTNADINRLLKRRLAQVRKHKLPADLALFTNIERLGRLLGLADVEKAILVFAVAVESFDRFKDAIGMCNQKMPTFQLIGVLARLLGYPEHEVRMALREDATLMTTGLLKLGQLANLDLENKLDLIPGIGSTLLTPHASDEALASQFLTRAEAASLELDAYPHLTHDIQILKDYLLATARTGAPGANILFHGPPGTGKTELTRALASAIGMELYEIPFKDEDGESTQGQARLRAYMLCQHLLARRDNVMLVFDEIEDVLPPSNSFDWLFGSQKQSTKTAGKAWVNRTLESNATPAFWITNDADIDPAYLRRFDYSVGFTVPPASVRISIARHHLGFFHAPESWLSRIAANERTTPAQYERAAKVARRVSEGDRERALAVAERTLKQSAQLLGQQCTAAPGIQHTAYDVSLLNTDVDVPKLIDGLSRRARGSFCFYGPPGTGKSALARHIADAIGKTFMQRRASDLLSPYVGEAERNLAEMFAQAHEQEAVLVLDEADSFLGERHQAVRSWEVTQVNELLTQMEAFEGLFVCTTNLMERLDAASLRRFSFKVKFDYLTAEQRWHMFVREFARLGGEDAPDDWASRVTSLEGLTPGDFAVAARQFELWDEPVTAGALYDQLHKECTAKGAVRRSIGFHA